MPVDEDAVPGKLLGRGHGPPKASFQNLMIVLPSAKLPRPKARKIMNAILVRSARAMFTKVVVVVDHDVDPCKELERKSSGNASGRPLIPSAISQFVLGPVDHSGHARRPRQDFGFRRWAWNGHAQVGRERGLPLAAGPRNKNGHGHKKKRVAAIWQQLKAHPAEQKVNLRRIPKVFAFSALSRNFQGFSATHLYFFTCPFRPTLTSGLLFYQ